MSEFHPLPGAYVCWMPGGAFIELYPRTSRLVSREGDTTFEALPAPATGAGTHFNLRVQRTRTELEQICAERKLHCTWRGWAGFLDVWLDDGLLIECVCSP